MKTIVKAERHEKEYIKRINDIDAFCKRLVIGESYLFNGRLDSTRLIPALKELLSHYPVLSGRVCKDCIVCDNQGVLLEERVHDDFFSSMLDLDSYPPKRFKADFDLGRMQKGLFPLMSICINHLKDTDLLDVRCSHLVLDGYSFFTMMKDLSLILEGAAISKKQFELPYLDGPGSKDIFEKYLSGGVLYKLKPTLIVSFLLSALEGIDRRTCPPLFIPNSLVEETREKHAGLSRNSILTSLTIRHLKEKNILDGRRNRIVVVYTVNHRSRISYIPEGYIGNAATPVFPVEVALTDEIGIAGRISSELKCRLEEEVDKEFLSLYLYLLKNRLPYMVFPVGEMYKRHPGVLQVNNFLGFPIYDMDLGAGRPCYVWPFDLPDPIRFWPSPPEKDGVFVYLRGFCAPR